MFRKSCPTCGMRFLTSRRGLHQPFRLTKTCRYCGAEYRVRKGLLHYALVVVVWMISLYFFVELGEISSSSFLQVTLMVLLLFVSFRLSMHIGFLTPIRRYE